MDWSLSKVIRIESGTVAVSTIDLRALLAHFGVLDAATVSALIGVARESKRPIGVDEVDHQFAARQAAATAVREYAPLLIPDLLQTEEYRRAVAADVRMLEGPQLEHAVSAGVHRQQVVDRADPAEMHFILDEAVLHRPVGGRGTMLRQREHLVRLSARRPVSIQVVPFTRGLYTGLLGPFVLLDFPEAGSLLYLEGRTGLVARADPDQVSSHLDHFQQLQHKLATDPDHLGEVMTSLLQPSRPDGGPGPDLGQPKQAPA
jgi:hypothetical protein